MNPTTLPLPLELTKPILLVGDLDGQFRKTLGSGKYDPKNQASCTSDGSSDTTSDQECESEHNLVVIDVTIDIQVDDVFADFEL